MKEYTDFAAIYDEAMEEIPYENWCDAVTSTLAELGFEKGTMCELGCGTGTLTELFAKKGYEMTGVDLSEEMLSQAFEKKLESGLPIQYICQDMRELELPELVDVMVSLCDSMNYLLTSEDVSMTFRQVAKYLKPNGIFLFDLKTRYCYETVMGDLVTTEETEEGQYIWENYFFPEEGINQYTVTMFLKEKDSGLYRKVQEIHEQKVHELEEIKVALEENGFSFVKAYGKQPGEEISKDAERIYIIAKRRIR